MRHKDQKSGCNNCCSCTYVHITCMLYMCSDTTQVLPILTLAIVAIELVELA